LQEKILKGSYFWLLENPRCYSSKAPWLKVIWVSLKVRSIYFNLEENSLLNVCVLLRRENIAATPNSFAKFSFTQGRAEVKLGEVC
jgi:hypothetical protein